IGNTGVNEADNESEQIWAAGYIVRDPSRVVSNWRAEDSLDNALKSQGIIGIAALDTRAITIRVRDSGAMRAGICSGEAAELSEAEQLKQVLAAPEMQGQSLTAKVSTQEPYSVPAAGESIGTLVVLDLGVKKSTLNFLSQHG